MLLASATSLFARPQLRDLNIRVVLSSNGDAQITETRQMTVDSEGTECYISIGNLNGSKVKNLQVSDETGQVFENIGSWYVDRSRSWKEHKCGIVDKGSGYELCWGIGESGERTYITSYSVTNLLKGYSDADGFNYMFVAKGLSPYPEHVKLTIFPEEAQALSKENTGVWGFLFRGVINLSDEGVVAETTEAFDSQSAMIVMVRFEKGLFAPTDVRDGSFEEVKERAFEGSDYDDDDYYGDVNWSDPETLLGIIIVAFSFLAPIVGFVWASVYKWRARHKINKDLLWYRDIPMNGDLQRVNNVLNAYKWGTPNYNNLLSASILRLISLGAITIEQHPNSKGKLVDCFVINRMKELKDEPFLIHQLHHIFEEAAGGDRILEPKELKSYMKSNRNEKVTDTFVTTLRSSSSIKEYKDKLEEVRQVFGLKKFLKEFSLLEERHVKEVALWKDYMIFATLFGIADQVIKDMKKINPEYFNMDKIASQMADDMTLPAIHSALHSGAARAYANKAARESRSSGGGGHSSHRGGGGGFSGGGHGGGIR